MKFSITITGNVERYTLIDLLTVAGQLQGKISSYQVDCDVFDCTITDCAIGSEKFIKWEEAYKLNPGLDEIEHMYARLANKLGGARLLSDSQRQTILTTISQLPAIEFHLASGKTLQDMRWAYVKDEILKANKQFWPDSWSMQDFRCY